MKLFDSMKQGLKRDYCVKTYAVTEIAAVCNLFCSSTLGEKDAHELILKESFGLSNNNDMILIQKLFRRSI